MVIGSLASYTKTKSVESDVWCLLTLDDDGVEQVVVNSGTWTGNHQRDWNTWTGSGSELLFFFSNNNQDKTQMKMMQIIEQRIILNETDE